MDINYYKKYIGINNDNSALVNDLTNGYNNQLSQAISPFSIIANSNRGELVTIINNNNESKQCRVVIDYGNQINKVNTNPLTREMWSTIDEINIGNYVYRNINGEEKVYLTLQEGQEKQAHDVSFIRECNHILKFYNPLSKLIQIPCIAENNLGILDENSTMSTGNAKLTITMSNNNLTQDIKRNKRLICDGTAWHVTNITKLQQGLIELTCEEEEPQNGDDLINEIPKNEYLPISVLLDINYSINLGSTLKLNPIITQGDTIINLPLIFTSDNTNIVTIDNLGNITTVGVGTANITCSLEGNENIKFISSIEVVNEVIVDNFTYDINSSNGLWIIKKTTTISYTAHKYNNLVEVPNTLFDFSISNYNGLPTSSITIIPADDYTIKIKANLEVGSFTLKATERGTTNYIEKTIELKNIYGS